VPITGWVIVGDDNWLVTLVYLTRIIINRCHFHVQNCLVHFKPARHRDAEGRIFYRYGCPCCFLTSFFRGL